MWPQVADAWLVCTADARAPRTLVTQSRCRALVSAPCEVEANMHSPSCFCQSLPLRPCSSQYDTQTTMFACAQAYDISLGLTKLL